MRKMKIHVHLELEADVLEMQGGGTMAKTEVNIGVRKRKMFPVMASGPETVAVTTKRLAEAVKTILEGKEFL